ncbi:MAG TPA: MFS transporter [Streptosporangiaceae bacterium]|nr:MFS transporter [Streptosporangiaceae bacterium]
MNNAADIGTAGECTAAAPVLLRRNAGFRMLWIGQVLSDTGTNAALIAYPLLILALTHSAILAGITGTVRLVVQIVLGLPGGALSDRFDRRLVMIACDSVRAAALALLAVLVLVHLVNWPVVMVVSVVDGGANVLFDSSASAALPVVVHDSQLEQAYAATEARTYAASLVGPALGGFLFGLGSSVPFVGDALSYLVSVGTVSRIRGRFRPQRSGERKSLGHEIAEGLRLVWQSPLLRAVVLLAPLINFAFSGVIFTITVALRQHGIAPGVIGLAQAGIAVGGLLGAIVAPRLQGRLPLSQLVIVMTVAATALFIVAALVLPSPLVALPVAITLVLAPTANAALFAAMLRIAPEDMRGRVTSTVIMAATGLAALSPLTAGLLLQNVSDRWAVGAFAASIGVAAIMCIALPWLREAEATDVAATTAAATDAAEAEAGPA